ncbi:MAG: hypothetical protein INR62_10170, partial [Rhodospirillales bacterium]|nr:hypothetical protein [Acetobacter sp.]
MDSITAQFVEFATKGLPPIAALVGSVVGIAVWWTSYRTQLYQNTKLELDVLVAASDKATQDEKYRKLLEDLRKEKLASLAFGCTVRTGELGRLMSYYDLGFANAREIGIAWMHRNDSPKPLSFRLHGFDRFAFLVAVAYMIACVVVGVL